MFSWTVLPNETLKLKKNDILLIFKSTVFIFTAYVICPQETKKKMINKLKNTLKYNDKA